MNKRQAKIEALQIASTVINELIGSDCTESYKIKNELSIISSQLYKRAGELKKK